MFEKIDKTDGLINKNLKLSETTILTIDKWKNAFDKSKSNDSNNNNEIVDVVIGFDFGTSSSKIVVSFPFNGDIDTFAFPVPRELRADNHEHC